MNDKLKKFVDSHRDEFDAFEPRSEVWQQLDKKLNHEKGSRLIWLQPRQVWKYAASVAILLSIGYGLIEYGRHMERNRATAPMASLERIAPEMAEIEAYYISVINQKKQKRNSYDLKKLGLDRDFQRELAQLDSTYAQLKQELYSSPNKQPVINAMVQNLQIRISILNQQLEVLNQIKQVKTEQKNENVTI